MLVVAWFAFSVPAAIGVGAMLSGGSKRDPRSARPGAPAPAVVLVRR